MIEVGDVHKLSLHRPSRLFALIIGINEYPNIPNSNLKGAVADADNMRDYLQNRLGVPSCRIKNLRDHGATRATIIEEIQALSFNKEIKKARGDPILIYYAGHGGSTDTPEEWKAGNTGKLRTEFLIPYDYSGSSLKDGNVNLKLTHGIPDRTLGFLLLQLAGKKGDNIVRQNLPYRCSPSTNYVTDCHSRLLSLR